MFSEEVTDKDGNKRTVVASSKDNLKDGKKAVADQSAVTYPNINVPVAKGHDLVEVEEDLTVKLVNGTGAHNSPNNAVEPFNPETDPSVPVAGLNQPDELKVGEGLTRAMKEDARAEDAKTVENADK